MSAPTHPLRADIERAHNAAQASARDAVAGAIRCGELLLEAKARIGHGAFGEFCKSLSFSDRMARGYMRLARLGIEDRQRVADLSLRRALQSLAVSRTNESDLDIEPETYNVPALADIEALAVLPSGDEFISIEPAEGRGYFHLARVNRCYADIVNRPVRECDVPRILAAMRIPAGLRWHAFPAAPRKRSKWDGEQ